MSEKYELAKLVVLCKPTNCLKNRTYILNPDRNFTSDWILRIMHVSVSYFIEFQEPLYPGKMHVHVLELKLSHFIATCLWRTGFYNTVFKLTFKQSPTGKGHTSAHRKLNILKRLPIMHSERYKSLHPLSLSCESRAQVDNPIPTGYAERKCNLKPSERNEVHRKAAQICRAGRADGQVKTKQAACQCSTTFYYINANLQSGSSEWERENMSCLVWPTSYPLTSSSCVTTVITNSLCVMRMQLN